VEKRSLTFQGKKKKKEQEQEKPTKARSYKSYICPICGKTVRRIHDHLAKSPHFLKSRPEQYRKMLGKSKLAEEQIVIVKLPIKKRPHPVSNLDESCEDNTNLNLNSMSTFKCSKGT